MGRRSRIPQGLRCLLGSHRWTDRVRRRFPALWYEHCPDCGRVRRKQTIWDFISDREAHLGHARPDRDGGW